MWNIFFYVVRIGGPSYMLALVLAVYVAFG
jgi:hypothetical protein